MKRFRLTKKQSKKIISITFLLLGALALAVLIDVHANFQEGRQLSRASQAYQAPDPNASFRILVAGDSTAVGTGVEDPSNSTAGRLHADFPDASLENIAFNGATISQVRDQFRRLQGERYDLVLLQVGANDIAFFYPLETSAEDLEILLDLAGTISDNVIYLIGGNASLAPGLTFPTNLFYAERAHTFYDVLRPIAEEKGAHYVDLYTTKEEDPFRNDPERFFAEDFLHLSDEGYGVWYGEIRKILLEIGLLE